MSKNELTKAKQEKRLPWSTKERKYVLPKGTRFDTKLIPIIQNLVAAGLTESDIGMIVGYVGENAEDWLKNMKQIHPELKDACKIGKKTSNALLVAQMFRSATGYDYEESDHKPNPETGEIELDKVKVKHQPGNGALAMFLATNLMPDQFKHKVELTKSGYVLDESSELSSDQIEKLAGRLLEESKRVKELETAPIDVEFEVKELEVEPEMASPKNYKALLEETNVTED